MLQRPNALAHPTIRPSAAKMRIALPALLLLGACVAESDLESNQTTIDTAALTGSRTPRLLVSTSRGNSVMELKQFGSATPQVLVAAGAGGLDDPDAMAIGPDGKLYVSSGRSPENSAILRYDARTGAFLNVFASGHGLYRPYGLAFGPDQLLYVSSFRSDELFRFDARTGAFVDVVARGDGRPGGLNGPNGLLFGPDGALYITTEGSVAGEFPGLPSEVLRMNVATGVSTVFIAQPVPSPSSFGFVSLLGMGFGPNCAARFPGSCDLFVSDFANDVRRYNPRTGELKAQLDTNYTGTIPSGNFVGGLAFGVGSRLFVTGFDVAADNNPGAVLRYDGFSGRPLPSHDNMGAQFVAPTAALARPIGILAINPRD
jgi:sugar lactone lactonase YvrE